MRAADPAGPSTDMGSNFGTRGHMTLEKPRQHPPFFFVDKETEI